MQTFLAEINVMPHQALLDPQGKAVLGGMSRLSLNAVSDVRIGKRIEMTMEAENESQAREMAEKACKNLLANEVMEYFEITIKAVANA
jgi:phosphoribosylformylglycinamidine synthase